MADQARYFNASGKIALRRLRDYARLAEAGNLQGLLDALDRGTTDEKAHPNAVILEAVRILCGLARANGKSAIPTIDALISDFDNRENETRDRFRDTGLWSPS